MWQSRTSRQRKIAALLVFICAQLPAAPSLAEDATPPASRYGFSVGAFASQFLVGDAGPVTLVSQTLYSDTFSAGGGVTRRTGGGAITPDLRFQYFGIPEPASWPLAAATGGWTLLFGVGYEWELRR